MKEIHSVRPSLICAWKFIQKISLSFLGFMKKEENFNATIIFGAGFLAIVATISKSLVSYPIIFFGMITALFAYQSYKFTKEKFRLDLREERIPSFNAMKKFISVFLGAGVHPLPEQDQMPMDEWYYRLNTQVIEQATAEINRLKNKPEDEAGNPLIEDIWILYGADVKNILQEAQAALFRLEHSWPKEPSVYLTAESIREDINPHLITLSQCGHDLSRALIKYMEFGEYSK